MLSAELFPLPLSVQAQVLERFAPPAQHGGGAQAMSRKELIDYLCSTEDYAPSPLDAVLRQAEQIGDPALPAPADAAVLAWLGAAFATWEERFPLEQELASCLRQLKPLLAQVALSDPKFAVPGAHSLHQLLDSLYDAAVGWQPDLGRMGEPTVKLVQDTVADLLSSLENDASRLKLLVTTAIESARRQQARAGRMMQRSADVERARLRAARAKEAATQAINTALAQCPLPPTVGRFLCGPWFDSAQLVLLKFGVQSTQWSAMRATMMALVHCFNRGGESYRGENAQSLDSVSQLCADLRQWLLSLQHEGGAVEQVLGVLEYTLLRALRGEAVESRLLQPIPLDEPASAGDGEIPAALEDIAAGQWLILREQRDHPLRVQVALRQEEQRQLLLCRQSGQQVRSIDFHGFAGLLDQGGISLLHCGASFSRSLAAAAGITSAGALEALGAVPVPNQGATRPARSAPATEVASKAATAQPGTAAVEPLSEVPELPSGTWLGFHDTDPPLLAKLALHDPQRRLLIFVNRKGIELRRLSEEEYLALIQQGQVDILEARSNFREEVERTRQRLRKHGHMTYGETESNQ